MDLCESDGFILFVQNCIEFRSVPQGPGYGGGCAMEIPPVVEKASGLANNLLKFTQQLQSSLDGVSPSDAHKPIMDYWLDI